MKEEDKIPKKNSTVSFNIMQSVFKKLKIINYAEEISIHAASNHYGVSRPTIWYWIKEKEELMQATKKIALLNCI